MIIILCSIVNVIWGWGDAIQPFNEHKNLHFDNELNIHMSSQNHEESGYGLFCGFAKPLVLIAHFISWEKWVGREK